LKKVGHVILINQKSGEHPEKNLGGFYRVDFTRYPSNHFAGCRLNGGLCAFPPKKFKQLLKQLNSRMLHKRKAMFDFVWN
jgi:hypothetical protein